MTVSVHLSRAQFCANCENVTESGSGSTCPVCESRAIRPLSSFLDREPNKLSQFACDCGQRLLVEGQVIGKEIGHGLPRTLPALSEFIQIMTPERIRELLGVPSEGDGLIAEIT